MGIFDWLFRRRPAIDAERLLAPQKAMLNMDEPWRAFSPDPSSDLFPLQVGADNQAVYAKLRDGSFTVRRANGKDPVQLQTFASGFLLFGTAWETYSAVALGNIKKQIDAGYPNDRWGFVLLEESDENVVEQLADKWYKDFAYVLGAESKTLIPLVGGVPFRVDVGDDGAVERVIEGVYCTQNLRRKDG